MKEKNDVSAESEAAIRERARSELPACEKESVLRQVAAFAVTVGKGAVALVDRLRGMRDPDEAISALDAQLKANRERREPLSARFESLYNEIAAKKRTFMAAPPAKKKILEMELRGLISEYQGIERQLAVYFENERMINTVRARTIELTAMGLRKISEKDIDKLTDEIGDAADDAADVSDAVRDLEKAGKRFVRDDADSFADALAGFDETFAETPAKSAEKSADLVPGFTKNDQLKGEKGEGALA